MLADYHVHSRYSADCSADMEDQIRHAVSKGLDEICFTEHVEYDFHLGAWYADLGRYTEERLREHRGIRIKYGIEAGLSCSDESMERIQREISEYDLDFVLASLHELRGMDPYMEGLFLGRDPTDLLREYFATLYERLCRADPSKISSVAHLDFLSKGFGKKYLPDGAVRYGYAPDELDAIFKWVINNGKCIEINTSTCAGNVCGDLPGRDWLKRYAELGGEYVTLGSDAHTTDKVGFMLREAGELARECGIKWSAVFHRMLPQFYRL